MQTQLPEGLRALINASQILQEESTPVVQTPVGPKPTVAGMVSQGLQQLAQPVGMQNVGQQAGLGAQIQAQQMARQQQMAQSPEAIAQLAAQMIQRRPEQEGIANLPANMGFREGGIIGYNGERESKVETPEERDAREAAEARAAGMRRSRGTTDFNERMMDAFSEAATRAAAAGSDVLSLPGRVAGAAFKGEPESYTPAYDVLRMQELAGSPEAWRRVSSMEMPREVSRTYRGTPDVREAIPELYARMYPERRQPAPAPTDRAEPSVALPAAPVAPTVEGMLAQARAIAPDTNEKSIKELQELRGREERFREGMENIEQQGIAAIQSAAQERRAAAQRTREDDNLRRFLSAMRSIRTGGDEYVKTLDALDQRDALSRQAEQNEQLAILKFKEAEQNRKLGKFDRERTDILKGNEYAQKARENFLKALQITTQADTSIFSTQSQARNVAMQTASAAQDRALAREQREKIETDRRIDAIDKTINELLQKRQAAKLAPQISMMMGNTPDAIKMREQQPDLWNNYVRDQAAINQQLQVLQNRRNQLVGIDGFGQLTVQ